MQTTYQMFIETLVPSDELIVSRTDLQGNITYANETFAQISGYEVDELIGKPHNIVRHPDMPRSIFQTLWQSLAYGQMWRGYVKNLRKDGGYYWVYAEVSGVYKEGVLVEYKSLRAPIDEATKVIMQKAYDERKTQEEKISRAVIYLQSDLVEKLEKLAHEQKRSADEIMNEIVSDTLF
ncbi:PAS domain-containing protein [Sulfurospirillum halorespirans]|uniref:NifL-like regulatory protein n=1 Tax=Sulfurospirillum halorespirans DSM 13726 TaxID=1193502 RepID=A0A1D7TIC3_9BACT|nr:NifL-like regulatory protein [Sulfurospirillum halorespirans DSM 13726]